MPDISNHAVCQTCRGICCARFQIHVAVKKDGDGFVPDWEKQAELYKTEKVSDFEFIKSHFVPLRQPGDAIPHFSSRFDSDMAPIWFTCTAFKDGRCSKYSERPQICRIHLCDPAERHGVNPELHIERVSGKINFIERFPGIREIETGHYDLDFRPVVKDWGAYTFADNEIKKWMEDNAEGLAERALKRAGIETPLAEFIEALDAKQKAEREEREKVYAECAKAVDELLTKADPDAERKATMAAALGAPYGSEQCLAPK